MGFDLKGIMIALILIGTANSAPVIARNLFGAHFSQPIDGGVVLNDNQPLFGSSKTWRGLFAAVVCSAAISPLLGVSSLLGSGFGAVSIGADLLASFTKRRLGYAPSSRARLLDVFPEALLPVLVFQAALGLDMGDILITALLFFVLEAAISPLLYRWHIRNRPY
jgi:CDP-diglyceride synthetase